jgi:hypothetical protein
MILAAFGATSTGGVGLAGDAPAAQGAVRRLTEAQYRRTISDVFGAKIAIAGRFEPDLRMDGLTAVGAGAVAMTPGALERYDEIARGIADQVTGTEHRDRLVGCGPGPGDLEGAVCAANFIDRTGEALLRRPLTPGEARSYRAAATLGAKVLGDYHAGLSAALAGMLSSPGFLFRIDVPRPGAATIDGYSRATRLSYLLWNTGPDAALRAAAGAGELDTPAGLSRAVDRMIASPRFGEGVRAFFTDMLQLDDLDTLPKDALLFPAFSPTVAAALKEQTLRTIEDALITRKADYRDLFTSRRLAMTRVLGPIYAIPVATSDWTIHEFPDGDPRTGLLTQASLLALHSHPGRTSPTLRGKAIREALLCEEIPSPPANVNFAVVQDVDNATLRTTRARLSAHLDDEECASCHKSTDGIGLGLEQFDGAGQFRKAEHDVPIDASGTFDKRDYADARSLGELFRTSPKIPACLVATAWRYAAGRPRAPGDAAVVARLETGFAANGYRIEALMRAMALDDALYVAPAPARQRLAGSSVTGKTGS